MFHSLSSAASNQSASLRATPARVPQNHPHSPRPQGSGRTTLALSQMTTYRQSFAEDVLCCQAAGISRLAVWRRKLDAFGLERAIDLLQDHNISVSSLNWGGGFTGGNGFSFHEAIDETREAIFQAARLGAHALTIISGPRAGHIHSHARRLLLDGLAATVEFAAEHGITLALQPMAVEYAQEWTFLDSLEEALEVVDGIAHPYLGLAVGTCHLWQQPGVVERLRQVAPHVATVQLSDWQPGRGESQRLLPGTGEVPIAAMVQALQQGGYLGDYELDVWSSSLWKSGCDTWLARTASDCQRLIAPQATLRKPQNLVK